LVVVGARSQFVGPQWQDQPASEKEAALWVNITANSESAPWPTQLQDAEILLESMDPTFDYPADQFPYQGLFNLTVRQKLIHSVGAIAQAQFVAVPNNYTGLFQGSPNNLLRLSTAQQPDVTNNIFIPGISWKHIIDNHPSLNIMAMFTLSGQPSFNFFKNDLSNHPPYPYVPTMSTAEKIFLAKFATASDWPTMLGLSHLASWDANGNPVENPNFPWRLIFHPTDAVHTLFPDQYPGIVFQEQLTQLKPNTVLFDVYAVDSPNDDLTGTPPTLIGSITILTSPTTTYFGDASLFFQHWRKENDFALRPDWLSTAKEIVNLQQYTANYTYPNLPWNSDGKISIV
jgi:hypothetical protein